MGKGQKKKNYIDDIIPWQQPAPDYSFSFRIT
jgi:hypothetical protein